MTRRSWSEPEPCSPDSSILAACDGDTLLAGILFRRGFRDPEHIRAFLSAEAYSPAPPEQLPGLVAASELLGEAIAARKRVLVWGDFDVDGQTATALLVDALERLGAPVDFYVPLRATESHGITVSSLQRQIAAKAPGVLLTCDTGTTEYEAVDYARSHGLTVIVTDHHELGERLPNANAFVSPARLPAGHALSSLPGVGVAYKLIQHLFTTLRRERDLPRLLDLVALGIVGDVATLTGDTRYLLQCGLDRLRRTERIGLLALMEAAGIAPEKLSAEQIGFQIGPRLNAAGRLGDASLAVELLTTHNRSRARILAQQFEGYNSERRVQTSRIEAAADKLIDSDPSLLESAALVLHDPDWHPGVVGIVAARLAERYQRPVVMLAGPETARGSARSVAGIDIGRAIAAQADLLDQFGGHSGAAGLSLPVEAIGLFRQRLSEALAGSMDNPMDRPPLQIDSVVRLDELTLDLVKRLHRLAPFGDGNPPITLAVMDVRLARAAMIGRDRSHRRLLIEDSEGRRQTIIWWRGGRETLPDGPFDIAFTVGAEANGDQEFQLTLIDIRERQAGRVEAPPVQLEDWRREADPPARLASLLSDAPDSQVWAEAYSRQQHPTWKRRAELTPASSLIIYTVPPDPQTLRDALERVQPQTIHLLGVPPPLPTLDAFLAQLDVAARNVIERLDGKVHPDILCGATAQSVRVVRAGLDYLVADGQLGGVDWRNRASVVITPPNGTGAIDRASTEQEEETLRIARARLEAAFGEVEAYRRHFRAASPDHLLAF